MKISFKSVARRLKQRGKQAEIGYLLRELLIVFIGVLAAFLLNDYWNGRKEKREQKQIYQAVYDDLNRFYLAANNPNDGFIKFFKDAKGYLKKRNKNQKLPSIGIILPMQKDLWNMEVLDALMFSGRLADVDSDVFLKLSRLYGHHKQFLREVDTYNSLVYKNISPHLDKDPSFFYNDDGTVKRGFKIFNEELDIIEKLIQRVVRMVGTIMEYMTEQNLVRTTI